MARKGQVSTELIIIIAAIMVIFIPIIVTVYMKASDTEETLLANQAQLAASRIANMVNSVGNLGEGSSADLEIYLPKNAESITFINIGKGSEITIKLMTREGESDISETAKYPIKIEDQTSFENIGNGKINMEIKSESIGVVIRRKS
ncbi:MAG: hypothetical protein ABII22_04180 [Candidatus Micrarchaeota archaeon]